jgi:hypothetical protein
MPGRKKYKTIAPGRVDVYKKLKKRYGKELAAKIANAGKTKMGRKIMAKKAAASRKRSS